MTTTDQLQDRYAEAVMLTYGMPPLALARGRGCVVWDLDGNSYLDLVGGIAVSALGHAPPRTPATQAPRGQSRRGGPAWCTPRPSPCTSRRSCWRSGSSGCSESTGG